MMMRLAPFHGTLHPLPEHLTFISKLDHAELPFKTLCSSGRRGNAFQFTVDIRSFVETQPSSEADGLTGLAGGRLRMNSRGFGDHRHLGVAKRRDDCFDADHFSVLGIEPKRCLVCRVFGIGQSNL